MSRKQTVSVFVIAVEKIHLSEANKTNFPIIAFFLKKYVNILIIYTLLLNSLKIQQVYPSPIRLKTLLPQDLSQFCANDQCKVIFPNNTITILPLEQFYAFIVANSSRNGHLDEESSRIEEIHRNDIAQSISPIYEHQDEKINTPAFQDIATTMTFKYETTNEDECETTLPDSTPFLYSQPEILNNVNNMKVTLEKSYQGFYSDAEYYNSTSILPIPNDYATEMAIMVENHDIANNSPENESTHLNHPTDNDSYHSNVVHTDRQHSPVSALKNFTPTIMADQYTGMCKVLYPNGTIIEQCPSEVHSHEDKSTENPIGHPITDSEGFAVSTDANGNPIYTDRNCNPITDRHGDPAFTDECQNPITDCFGYAVYTDKDGNWITDSHGKALPTDHNHRPIFTNECGNMITDKNGNAIYTNEAGNMITDKNGNAIYTDKDGKWMTDANGMAIDETPVYTYSDGKPITDEKGHYVYTDSHGNPILKGTTPMKSDVITDKNGNAVYTDKAGNMITDKNGNAIYTDKDGRWMTDSNGIAITPIVYTYSDGKPITDEKGHYVYTDSHGNPILKGTTQMKSDMITDKNGNIIYTDKAGNMITDKNGNAIYTNEAGNMITDRNGNAIYTDKEGKWMTDSNGMAITPIIYTYSDGKPITDEKGHYVYTDSHGNPILKGTTPMKSDVITDKNGNVIYTDKAGNMITDKNGNAVYTDKDGNWMTDRNGMAITPIIYTYSDGKPITDEQGHYVYTDSHGNPVFKGTTPMESSDDYVYEDTSTEFYDYDSYVEKIPIDKMEEAKKMTKCISKKINPTNIVCVCNFTYCDKFLPIRPLPKGKYLWVTSTKRGLRFEKQKGEFSENKGSQDAFFVNSERKFQNIFGFGGTFTDSASASIQHLRANIRNNLLESYFGFFGIHYTIGRVPIGGTNSFPLPYTYLDHTNGRIEEFMLTEYDYKYKIPVIQQANAFIHDTTLRLIASAWLAPKWMNEKCNYSYAEALKRDYWPLWAQYHIKFFDQYASQNITFWALTTGSEPMFMYQNTTMPSTPSISWSPYDQQQWVAHHLVPELHNSTYDHLLILAFDGNRANLPFYMKWFFENFHGKKYKNLQYFKVNEAYEEISGIALHWYKDTKENLKYLDWINELYPNKFLIYTEACCVGVTELGSWDCAERYAINIITNLNHWVSGWIDWNLALELEDEANLKTDTSSPIIINADKNEFYKQPNYYVLGHFSKFILPNSIRIEITPSTVKGVSAVAVQRPDAGHVIIFYNQNEHDQAVVFVVNKTKKLSLVVAAKSINSVIFW